MGTTGSSRKTDFSRPSVAEAPFRPAVVVITLDGVRSEDVFLGAHPWRRRRSYRDSRTRLLPFLWRRLSRSKSTVILGNRYAARRGRRHFCTIDNPSGRSLPAYADLFSALRQKSVKKNDFRGRIPHPSIFDRLIQGYDYQPNKFAFFTSWDPIRRVVSQDLLRAWFIDAGYQNVGPRPFWHDARYDRETFRSVLRYLQKRPDFQFLFVGFNDSDEWGHAGSYRRYLSAIRRQDAYIKAIMGMIERDPRYQGKTVYLITTDHGRGHGRYWKRHAAYLSGPRFIWAFLHFPKSALPRSELRTRLIQNLRRHCSHTGMARFVESLLSL